MPRKMKRPGAPQQSLVAHASLSCTYAAIGHDSTLPLSERPAAIAGSACSLISSNAHISLMPQLMHTEWIG